MGKNSWKKPCNNDNVDKPFVKELQTIPHILKIAPVGQRKVGQKLHKKMGQLLNRGFLYTEMQEL